jgi:glycosyltransferase involved in cell wall biosynthesis
MILSSMWQYLTHRFDPEEYRLIMTILCKDEADIIEANIRVHAALGVDGFVVMDNGSTDGTRETLSKLEEEFELLVIDREGVYNQSAWMTEMAHVARDEMGADWVISNDADEFWLPQSDRSLKQILARPGSVLTCHRYNMLMDERALEDDYRFYDCGLRVENPIYYHNEQLSKENVSIVLSKIGPKTIVNPHGLIKVKGGNHRAKHVAFKSIVDYMKPYDKLRKVDEIKVYHFSMRGWKHFESNILNRKRLIEEHENVRMGNHYRRWVKLYNEGKLKAEFENFIFRPEDIGVLGKYGVVIYDDYPIRKIRKLLGVE